MTISAKSLILFFLVFQIHIASAQNNCTIVSTSFGYLFYNKINGNFSETFPYSSKDVTTGITTRQTFQGSLQNPFAANIFFIDILNVEVVRRHHSINGGIGMNSDMGNNYSAYFKGGYSYVIPVFHFLFLKPGVDLMYMFGYDETMGIIDNKNKIIDLLGHEAGSQFSIPASKYSPAKTFDADQLAINYRRAHFMACPKLAITNRPGKTVYCGIEVRWSVTLIQTDTLRPDQMVLDTNRDQKVLMSLGINNQGAVASFNQVKISKSPPIAGLYIAMKVGCYVKAKAKTPAKVS